MEHQNAAEEIAHQVRFISRAEIGEMMCKRHPDRPHDADDRIRALFRAAVHPAVPKAEMSEKMMAPSVGLMPQVTPSDAAMAACAIPPLRKQEMRLVTM